LVTALLLGIAGLAILTLAADQLVIGASRVASWLRVAPIVVGVIVVGVGTSAPEFLVSGLAAAQGNGGLAVGNLVGSNILNLTLILGIAGVIRPLTVASTVVRREVPLTVAGMAVLAVAVLVGLELVTGAILAVATVAVLWLLIRTATATPDRVLAEEVDEFVAASPPLRPAVEVTRTLVGLAGVLAGAQLLVENAARVAVRLGVSQLVVGATLVALGTSLPELVTSIQAQRRGEPDLVMGNLLGSNLFNSLAGGAIVGLAGGGATATIPWPLPAAMLGVGVVTWALIYRGARLGRWQAGVLLGTYALCMPLLF
jgi:cation:H+ antiporter